MLYFHEELQYFFFLLKLIFKNFSVDSMAEFFRCNRCLHEIFSDYGVINAIFEQREPIAVSVVMEYLVFIVLK